VTGPTRKEMRRTYSIVVPVHCANPACNRVVAELYGSHLGRPEARPPERGREYSDEAVWAAWWSALPVQTGEQTGIGRSYGFPIRWRCPGGRSSPTAARRSPRCKGDYPLRGEKLDAAFRLVAARPDKRDRVITLPIDMRALRGKSSPPPLL
jgi:hypothetical protein